MCNVVNFKKQTWCWGNRNFEKGRFSAAMAEDTSPWIITHTLKSFLSNTQHKGLVNGVFFLRVNSQDLAKAAEPDNDEKNGERSVCGGGEWGKQVKRDGTNLTAPHFSVTSARPVSPVHPSWMTIAPRFAYQKRFPICAFQVLPRD